MISHFFACLAGIAIGVFMGWFIGFEANERMSKPDKGWVKITIRAETFNAVNNLRTTELYLDDILKRLITETKKAEPKTVWGDYDLTKKSDRELLLIQLEGKKVAKVECLTSTKIKVCFEGVA